MILGFPKVWEHKGITNKIKQVLCVDNQCIRTFARSPAWGFGVARFDLQGHSQEPLTVKRATVQGFTLFLCLEVQSFLINLRVAEVLSPTKL